MITIIAAVAANGAIGRDNRLIYRLPDDMRRFKALTTGHTVVMGRRTYESLPKGALPHRRNIIVSSTLLAEKQDGLRPELPEVVATLTEAVTLAATTRSADGDGETFIIGGARLYEEALRLADRLCLTEVADTPAQADAFFPAYGDGWREVRREQHPADDRHDVAYAFVDYVRHTDRH